MNANADLLGDAAYVAGYLSAWLTATVATIPEQRRRDVEAMVTKLEAAIAASTAKEPADV